MSALRFRTLFSVQGPSQPISARLSFESKGRDEGWRERAEEVMDLREHDTRSQSLERFYIEM